MILLQELSQLELTVSIEVEQKVNHCGGGFNIVVTSVSSDADYTIA
jgi:hypothetical protein